MKVVRNADRVVMVCKRIGNNVNRLLLIKPLYSLRGYIQNFCYLGQQLFLHTLAGFELRNLLLSLAIAKFKSQSLLLDAQHFTKTLNISSFVYGILHKSSINNGKGKARHPPAPTKIHNSSG